MNVSRSAPTIDGRCSALRRAYSATLAACAFLAFAAPGCGGEEGSEPESRTETAQPVPALPEGWKVSRNDAGGFALGVPPGWREARKAAATRLTAPGEVVVITVTPDRSDEVLTEDLETLARGTAAAYGENFKRFDAATPRRYRHGYDAFAVTAKGTNRRNDQELQVILVRRRGLVTFTVFVQEPKGSGGINQPLVDRIVRSIRSRPVG